MQLKEILSRIWHHIVTQTNYSTHHHVTFGLMMLIGFIVFYYFNVFFATPTEYENLPLRVGIGFLGSLIALKHYWPNNLKKYLPILWYSLLLYLPFFFSLMLCKNPESSIWHINGLVGLVAVSLFVNWIEYIILIIMGSSLGIFAYFMFDPSPHLPFDLFGIIGSYFGIIIYLLLFNRKNIYVQRETIQALKSLSGAIAHELRTPLASINAGLEGINDYFPQLYQGYTKAHELGLIEKPIHRIHFQLLETLPPRLIKETRYAFTIIDMLLMKLKDTEKVSYEKFMINECIAESLERYPFTPYEQERVHWTPGPDFMVQGEKVLLMHVFFNLLKNALYFLKAANKGEITISVEKSEKTQRVIFKDTGKGINAKFLPLLFEPFFTKTPNGTGLGLAFCKTVLQDMDGSISAESIEGEYTTFTLEFPIL